MRHYNVLLLRKCFSCISLTLAFIGIVISSARSAQGNSNYLEPSHESLNILGALLVEQGDKDQKIYAEIYEPSYIVELRLGGNLEDKPHYVPYISGPTECNDGRFMQHFYHPYTPQGPDNGLLPLSHTVGDRRCLDAVTWARSSAVNSEGEDAKESDSRGKIGDLTWIGAIESYDYTFQAKQDAYQRLGHVSHLVGDMAQPEHVHLEPHPPIYLLDPEGRYETWVNENWASIQPDITQLFPVHYQNMEDYLKELAKISYNLSSFEGGELFRNEERPIDENKIFAKMFSVGYVDSVDFKIWGLGNYFDSAALGGYDGTYQVYHAAQGFWETKKETSSNSVPSGFYYVEDITRAIPEVFPTEGNQNHLEGNPNHYHLSDWYANKLLPLAVTYIAGLYQHYYDIVNHPPYIYRVTVLQNDQCLYNKYWEDVLNDKDLTKIGSRRLVSGCNTPGFISKNQGDVTIKIEFGSEAAGTAKKMSADSVSVALVDGSGGVCPITGQFDNSESVWTGGINPASVSGCAIDGILTFQITAKDRHNHYPGRTPLGDELDQAPDTPAKAVITGPIDANAPLQYGWIGYEPGVDTNHKIDPEPRDEACTAEVNHIIGQTDGVPIEGTCGPDEVKADEVVTEEDNMDDNIKTYAGDDLIYADFSDVSVPFRNGGHNVVDAGPGNDEVYGGEWPDELYGGPGNDKLRGYDGDDILDGGEGNDILRTSGPFSPPYISFSRLFGGPGNDELAAAANAYLDGGDGNDNLGSGDHSTLIGGAGNDTLGTGGESEADGGPGDDLLSYESAFSGIEASLEGGSGDDIFYIAGVGKGSRVIIDGGSGMDEYVFKDVALLNSVRFTGGYDAGTIYYGSVSSNVSLDRKSLAKVPLWDTYHYTATYDAFTSAVTVTVLAGAEGEVVAGVGAQPVAIFTVEYFHNGMLGITGVKGAPGSPINPVPSASNFIYLPLIQKRP